MGPPSLPSGLRGQLESAFGGTRQRVERAFLWGLLFSKDMTPPAAKPLGHEERLYRDDVGAALERVRRLEQENQALRAEIEEIKAGQAPMLPSPYRIGTIALCIATIAVGASLAFSSATQPSVLVVEPPPPPTAILIEPVPQPVAPR